MNDKAINIGMSFFFILVVILLATMVRDIWRISDSHIEDVYLKGRLDQLHVDRPELW